MNPKEAIETLIFEDKATLPPRNNDFWNAVRLGKEALKLVQRNYKYLSVMGELPLPGETIE